MKRSLLALAPVIAIAFGGGLTAAKAQMPPPPPHEGFGGHGPHGFGGPEGEMLAGIDLTKSQKDAIHKIMKAAHDARKDHHDDGHQIHDQIEQMLLAPGPIDKTKLADLTQQEVSMMQASAAERMDIAVKIHDILTPEQLAQAKDHHDKMSALFQQMRELNPPKHHDEKGGK